MGAILRSPFSQGTESKTDLRKCAPKISARFGMMVEKASQLPLSYVSPSLLPASSTNKLTEMDDSPSQSRLYKECVLNGEKIEEF